MFKRYHLKPSRLSSALGLVFGLVMLAITLLFSGGEAGWSILFPIVLLVLMILYHGANVLRLPIPSTQTFEADLSTRAAEHPDFAAALRNLEALRADGLISNEEYATKRAEIMHRPWS